MKRVINSPFSRAACWYLVFFLSTGFPVVSGCATQGSMNIKSIRSEKLAREIDEGMSLVFGKARITINGEKWFGASFVIAASEENHSNWIGPRGDKEYPGGFFFQLDPGSYSILSIRLAENKFIEPTPYVFNIPEAGKAYYLGDMTIDIKGEKHIWKESLLEEINEISITDNYDEAKEFLSSRADFWKNSCEKSLFKKITSSQMNEMKILEQSSIKTIKDMNDKEQGASFFLALLLSLLGAYVSVLNSDFTF